MCNSRIFLWQSNKNTTVRAECFTQSGGPEEFKECRDWFLQDGEGFETNSKTGCITNREPPSSSQQECGQLYKQHPHTRKQMTKILFPDNTTVIPTFFGLFEASACVCRSPATRLRLLQEGRMLAGARSAGRNQK